MYDASLCPFLLLSLLLARFRGRFGRCLLAGGCKKAASGRLARARGEDPPPRCVTNDSTDERTTRTYATTVREGTARRRGDTLSTGLHLVCLLSIVSSLATVCCHFTRGLTVAPRLSARSLSATVRRAPHSPPLARTRPHRSTSHVRTACHHTRRVDLLACDRRILEARARRVGRCAAQLHFRSGRHGRRQQRRRHQATKGTDHRAIGVADGQADQEVLGHSRRGADEVLRSRRRPVCVTRDADSLACMPARLPCIPATPFSDRRQQSDPGGAGRDRLRHVSRTRGGFDHPGRCSRSQHRRARRAVRLRVHRRSHDL